MSLAYVGLGSNLDQPAAQIAKALTGLAILPATQLLRQSSLYRSPPWGYPDQPDFINAVAELETQLDTVELLAEMLALEQRLGRRRDGPRWGPRLIDLDLLVHGDQELETETVQVPHPRIAERAFVLMPLAELAPNLDLAGMGRVSQLLERLPESDCTRIAE